MIIVKLLKLPLKILCWPAVLALFLVHVACGVIIGLSSIVTNLLSGLFIFGAAAEWIAGMPDAMAYQCLGLGLFFLAAPHICVWLIDKVADLMYTVLGFISR